MVSFAEDLRTCRKILFARSFATTHSSNTAFDAGKNVDEPCGHCDNVRASLLRPFSHHQANKRSNPSVSAAPRQSQPSPSRCPPTAPCAPSPPHTTSRRRSPFLKRQTSCEDWAGERSQRRRPRGRERRMSRWRLKRGERSSWARRRRRGC
jgi:hypothetical protein